MQKRSPFEQLSDLKIPKKEKRAWIAVGVSLALIVIWLVLRFA